MTNENGFDVDESCAGERLDRFLAGASGLGLRAARRMIEAGRVLVQGRPARASHRLGAGQAVRVLGDAGIEEGQGALRAVLLKKAGDFAALCKPAGLNTASLAGGGGASLEAQLGGLLPEGGYLLVNRLDRDTSGIVLAAATEAARARFKRLEDESRVDKRYLAVVQGVLSAPVELRWALDTADRARTRVLDGPAADPLRVTTARPLAAAGGLTLVEARIAKGARHQIRAHLARAGHPILGDALYGGGTDAGGLRLHHWRCEMPGFCAAALPDWEEFKVEVELLAKENPCAD